MATVQAVQRQGWYLSVEGIAECTANSKDSIDDVLRTALNFDLKDVGERHLPETLSKNKAEHVDGPFVLQIQKIRNISAPKDNEESQTAPKMFKMTLTDGHNNCVALEVDNINKLSVNTPPGTKIKLVGRVPIRHGFLLLSSSTCKVLGGHVDKLVDSWQLKRMLANQARQQTGTEGGPPPFIPFGQKRQNGTIDNQCKDNFRSLENSKVDKKEDKEFELQRQAGIDKALQARDGNNTAKNFTSTVPKQVSDKDVARIVEMGFAAEMARNALRENDTVQLAINSLLTSADRKNGAQTWSESRRSELRGTNRSRLDGYSGNRRERGIEPGNRREQGTDPGNRREQGTDPGNRQERGTDPGNRRERGTDIQDQASDTRGETRGRGRRVRDDGASDDLLCKPSAPATLFDFLTNKIPSQRDTKLVDGTVKQQKSEVASTEGRRSRHTSDSEGSNKRGPQNLPPRLAKQQRDWQRNEGGGSQSHPQPVDHQGSGQASSPTEHGTDQPGEKRIKEQGYKGQGYKGQGYKGQGYKGQDREQKSQEDKAEWSRDYMGKNSDDYRGQRSEPRGQRSDPRGQRSDPRGQRSGEYMGSRSNNYQEGRQFEDMRGRPGSGHNSGHRSNDARNYRHGTSDSHHQQGMAANSRSQWNSQREDSYGGRHQQALGPPNKSLDPASRRSNTANTADFVPKGYRPQGQRDEDRRDDQSTDALQKRDKLDKDWKSHDTQDPMKPPQSQDRMTTGQKQSQDRMKTGQKQSQDRMTTDQKRQGPVSIEELGGNVRQAPPSHSKSADGGRQAAPNNSSAQTSASKVQKSLIPTSVTDDTRVNNTKPGTSTSFQSHRTANNPKPAASSAGMVNPKFASLPVSKDVQALMVGSQPNTQSYNIPAHVLQQFQGIQITGPPPGVQFPMSVSMSDPTAYLGQTGPNSRTSHLQGHQPPYIQHMPGGGSGRGPSQPAPYSVHPQASNPSAHVQPSAPSSQPAFVHPNYPVNISTAYDDSNKPRTSRASPHQVEGTVKAWKVGECCVAKYYPENQFYRAVIQSMSRGGQSCFVLFTDYGNIEEVAISDLRTIPVQVWEANTSTSTPFGGQP